MDEQHVGDGRRYIMNGPGRFDGCCLPGTRQSIDLENAIGRQS